MIKTQVLFSLDELESQAIDSFICFNQYRNSYVVKILTVDA